MADEKSGTRKPKTPVDRASDLARQIWLAGVGAYGQAFDETQEQVSRRVAKVSEETSKLFEDLVSRGSDLEQKIGALGKMGAEAGAEGLRRGTDMSLSLEDRLSRVRDMLGLAPAGSGLEAKVDRLESELAALNAKVDLLVEALAPARKAKPVTRKKTAAGKRAAVRKTTAAKKKAAGKKKPARKTSAKPKSASAKQTAKRT